jgi:hypothetical protein
MQSLPLIRLQGETVKTYTFPPSISLLESVAIAVPLPFRVLWRVVCNPWLNPSVETDSDCLTTDRRPVSGTTLLFLENVLRPWHVPHFRKHQCNGVPGQRSDRHHNSVEKANWLGNRARLAPRGIKTPRQLLKALIT